MDIVGIGDGCYNVRGSVKYEEESERNMRKRRRGFARTMGICIFVLLSIVVSNPAAAQAVTDDVEQTISEIDREIETNMKTHDIPGMAFAWVTKDQVVYSKGYGWLDMRDETAHVNEQTNFLLGSLSKVFVTLAVMQLQDQGKIEIEQPLVRYLPWFATKDPALSNEIKVRDLLNHGSGLPDRLNMHDVVSLDPKDRIQEMIRKLSKVALTHDPGEDYEYTNMNTDLLQVLIEEVTGIPFTDYMEEHIFKPLHMERTGYFSFNQSHLANSATGHRYHWGKLKPFDETLSYATSGSAGLSSNVEDLARFIGFLLNEGKGETNLQLSNESMQQMFRPNQQGMGFNWYVAPHNMYMEGGLPGMTSTIVLAADKSYGLVLLSNSKQDITQNSGFNLYRMIAGGTPSPLLASDYPKISSEAKLVLRMTIVVAIALIGLIATTTISLLKGKGKLRIATISAKRWIALGFISVFFVSMIVYVYVYLPFQIGVPSLYDFKKDPDIVQGLTIFMIILGALICVMGLRIVFYRKKDSSRSLSA